MQDEGIAASCFGLNSVRGPSSNLSNLMIKKMQMRDERDEASSVNVGGED